MMIEGNILKMRVKTNDVVQYYLPIGKKELYLNELIGKKLRLRFKGRISCIKCGRKISKSYAQGYCYPCFISIPETEECVLRPELCKAHLGISRNIKWAEKHCLQDHIVYLAISSGLKVGVTRKSQIPYRWIDQGAIKAIKLATTPNRYTAGVIEVELKKHFADKTNWRHMLTNEIKENLELKKEKSRVYGLLAKKFVKYFSPDNNVFEVNYPVKEYPRKVRSITFDKTNVFTAILDGIKGQYIIFSGGDVLNVRKHSGYSIGIEYI